MGGLRLQSRANNIMLMQSKLSALPPYKLMRDGLTLRLGESVECYLSAA